MIINRAHGGNASGHILRIVVGISLLAILLLVGGASAATNGLNARYYATSIYANDQWNNTGTPTATQIDPNINFSWQPDGTDPRPAGIGWGDFSADWNGYIDIPTDGNYTFATTSDDGSIVYIDNNVVVNNGGAHPPTSVAGDPVALTKGLHNITVKYWECCYFQSLITLFWTIPGGSQAIVPPSALFPTPALDMMKAAGVKWVRVDVKPSYKDGNNSINFVKAAQARGIKVLAIIKSNDFQPYQSNKWIKDWKNYVKDTVNELKFYDVNDWQIDNELNNYFQNSYTTNNSDLRDDVIKAGVRAAKSADPDGIIWVNLYYGDTTGIFGVNNNKDIRDYAELRKAGVKIDILGLDIYRDSYSSGSPKQYAKDFIDAHSIWNYNMAMTETGYFTAPLACVFPLACNKPHNETGQQNYVSEVFNTTLPFEDSNKWYKGTFIYEYKDEPSSLPYPFSKTESTFGLVHQDGATPKPAWRTFKENVSTCNVKAYICGIAYHI